MLRHHGGLRLPDRGSAPGPRWGTPVPQTTWPRSDNLWPPFAPPNSGS